MVTFFITEGIDEQAVLNEVERLREADRYPVVIHYHKDKEDCNERCYAWLTVQH